MAKFYHTLLSLFGVGAKSDFSVKYTTVQPTKKELKVNELVIVKGKKSPKWLVFRCPGDCGEILRLPLSKNKYPYWSLSFDYFDRPSIIPSVRLLDRCRAHFWLRNGKVFWCRDSYCGRSRILETNID